MTPEEIERALAKGKTLKIKTGIGDARISRSPAALRRWLDSGPHGEAAQDSIDDCYEDYDDRYEDY